VPTPDTTEVGPAFTQDEYGVVANSPDTYRAAAEKLRTSGCVSLGWTDNASSHMDVLLAVPPQVGPSNRMDNSARKLFVAVSGYGMFGFRRTRTDPLHPAYLAEKLGMRYSVTTEALSDLVNGVMGELA
jgi:hypothetical protein